MNQFVMLTPEDEELEELINKSSHLDKEYLRYLIHFILSKLAFHIENEDRNTGETINILKRYIKIHSKKDVLVRDDKHKEHIEFLCSNNINISRRFSRTTFKEQSISVLYRKDYVEGKHPFLYRINPRFSKKLLKVYFITDNRFARKIIEEQEKIPTIIKSGNYKFLSKYFNSDNLKIDIYEAINLCNLRYSNHRNYGKYINEMFQIIDFNNGLHRLYYNKDSDGRVHSNITRLPKVYRKFLKYKGKSLTEVDLSNSIIYFISMLLSNNISQDFLKTTPQLLTFCKSSEDLDTKEIELINKLSNNGIFYDAFIPEFEKLYSLEELKKMYETENDDEYVQLFEQTKRISKNRILAMLFAETKHYKIEQNIFKSKFPEILEQINNFKGINGNDVFSHLLFQLEAHYVIDKVGRAFNKKYWRKAPLFTLHDCLITTKEYSDKLHSLMIEQFESKLGIAPKMKVKPWI